MAGTVHVVGAGLAGLSAAVRLAEAGRRLQVHEAAPQAGGRCRSYHDPVLGQVIDNGNHLVLSGNTATLDYLASIGSAGALEGPAAADFPFADLRTGERWTLRLNEGRLPWWALDPRRRVPGTRVSEYLAPLRLLRAQDAKIGAAMACEGPLYERLLRPVLLAGLNTEPPEASAGLAASLLRETLGAGGRACRPLIATRGLSEAFVDPALRRIEALGGTVAFGRRLRAIETTGEAATKLVFADGNSELASEDLLVLAVPPSVAQELIPGLDAPDEFRAIVNAHFAVLPPPGTPLLLGIVAGLSEWLFAFPDRLSVTISAADRLIGEPREALAEAIWREVAALTGLASALPPWQIVREKRATFAATPAQDAKRPKARTRLRNVVLAGDWTATGLPGTIEGAVRSGHTAAALLAGPATSTRRPAA